MSDRRLRDASLALALLGLGIAGYLTYIHYAGIRPVCLASGCEQVQSSSYAKLAGVPVSVLGLIGYAAILVTSVLRVESARVAGAGFALTGLGFSAYLTYRELFTIKAICQWCVASAVLMALLAVITVIRALRIDPSPLPAGSVGSETSAARAADPPAANALR